MVDRGYRSCDAWMVRARTVIAALVMFGLGVGRAGATCSGDCNGDGFVAINELVRLVDIDLGNAAVSTCSAGDANHDGEVTIDEILAAVFQALFGCGASQECTTASCRTCTGADTLCQPGAAGFYCCTLSGSLLAPTPGSDPFAACDATGIFNPTPGSMPNGCWTAPDGPCHREYFCLIAASPTPTVSTTPTVTDTAVPYTATATASSAGTPTATPTVGPCDSSQTTACQAVCGLSQNGCCFNPTPAMASGSPTPVISCFDPTIPCPGGSCGAGGYANTVCGGQGYYTDACQIVSSPAATATPNASVSPTNTGGGATTPTPSGAPGTPSPTPSSMPEPSPGGGGLYAAIGIGADWGPHWSDSPSKIDARDNQDDSAFPPEICLLANAGFQSIRLYGENVETWMAVVDAVQGYNNGPGAGGFACAAGQQNPPAQPLSVVYQAAICGPDPASLPWNGAVTPQNIGNVTCLSAPGQMQPTLFVESLQGEILKLKQVLHYRKAAFASTVKLVLVGNEILFSSGTCASGGTACTSDADCSGSTCVIAHYCSGTLGGMQAQAISCAQQSDCGAVDGPNGLCTDITNGAALTYALDQIHAVLAAELGPQSVPPISISLQVDVMTGLTPGLPPATAPPLWSRQQLVTSLPSPIVAVNAYPDQWGLVSAGNPTPPYASCIEASNGVDGAWLGAGSCPGTAADYADPVTGTLAHTIDTDYRRLTQSYPGTQIMFAETGWHTAGTCSAYNDSSVSADRYSPGAAATYLQALYQYAAGKQIPLLVFELFDQKTKQCIVPTNTVEAEANYGVFTNYCEVKQPTPTPGAWPPGGNPANSNPLLSADADGLSCKHQSLLTIAGDGTTGVCAANTTQTCLTSCGANGQCVWGYCAENTSKGCNPDDPNNPSPCTCTRAGACRDTAAPSGYYAPSATPIPSCSTAESCSTVSCPFGTCGCYVALAPATLASGATAEHPGLVVQYTTADGSLQFDKAVGPLALVQPVGDGTYLVQPQWDNVVVGDQWAVSLAPPPGAMSGGTPSPCTNTVTSVPTSGNSNIVWNSAWSCTYAPNPTMINPTGTSLFLPRTFLSTIPSWPPE